MQASSHPGDGLVRYARADGGFSVWDAARNPGRHELPEETQRLPHAFHFDARQVWEGLEDERPGVSGRKVLCNGLIADWVL